MIDDFTAAVMAYLDIAEPKGEPWTYGDARIWIEGTTLAAKALREALTAGGLR